MICYDYKFNEKKNPGREGEINQSLNILRNRSILRPGVGCESRRAMNVQFFDSEAEGAGVEFED